MNDIENLNDIKKLVDEFYYKVQVNELIGPVFEEVVQNNWPQHLDKMYRFWQTILLSEHTYSGSPFLHHAKLPINKIHFDTWLLLFTQTADALFTGPVADEAKLRAHKMGEMFQFKMEYLKNNTPLL